MCGKLRELFLRVFVCLCGFQCFFFCRYDGAIRGGIEGLTGWKGVAGQTGHSPGPEPGPEPN